MNSVLRSKKVRLLVITGLLLLGLFSRTDWIGEIYAQSVSHWSIERDTTDSSKLKFYYNNDKANAPISVTTDNKVGIGTASPESILQVGSTTASSANKLTFGKSQTSSEAFLPVIQQLSYLTSGSSNDLALGATSTSGGIVFFTGAGSASGSLNSSSNVARMVITPDGNVGIGTNSPGGDKLDVRGRAYASGGWQTTDADYAEWFEKEETTKPGDIIGVNLNTGRVRMYRPGDKFIGIHSLEPGVVGNRVKETDEEMELSHTLVGLLGQLDFDDSQAVVKGGLVLTKDGHEIGVFLSNQKVLLAR
jgi:hypothetical protein